MKNLSGRLLIWAVCGLLIILLSAGSVLASDPVSWVGAFFVKGKVGLKWQPAEAATEYIVYRAGSDGNFAQLTTTDKTQYFDTQLTPGENYSYKVAYVGADGAEVVSDVKKVAIPAGAAGAFAAPTWTGVRVDRNRIFLRWDKVVGAIAYNIYRSTTVGGPYEVLGNATATRYADATSLEQGNIYYYVVTALNDMFEETEYSEEQAAQYGATAEELAAAAESEKVVLEDLNLTFLFDIKTAGGLGDLNQPADVYVNSKGQIYVTDALNFRVHCYSADGAYQFSFGERTPGDQTENPPQGTFGYPMALFIDKNDMVYVGDINNHDIQVFKADGSFDRRIRVAVEGDMKRFRPNGIHVLDDGRIVTTDGGNHRYLILDSQGKVLLENGGIGGEPGKFNYTGELVVAPDGTVCIVDIINCRVQEFDLEGNFVREFGQSGQTVGSFGRPTGLFLDDTGRLWVSDVMGHTVQVFTLKGEVKSAISGFEDSNLNLSSPRGMFINKGRLYLVNRTLNQVLGFEIG
jgi:sugar lactone lactonase YvrE